MPRAGGPPCLFSKTRQNFSIWAIRSTATRTISASVVTPSSLLARRSARSSTKKDLRVSVASRRMMVSNPCKSVGIHHTWLRHTVNVSTSRQVACLSACGPSALVWRPDVAAAGLRHVQGGHERARGENEADDEGGLVGRGLVVARALGHEPRPPRAEGRAREPREHRDPA